MIPINTSLENLHAQLYPGFHSNTQYNRRHHINCCLITDATATESRALAISLVAGILTPYSTKIDSRAENAMAYM